MDEIEITVFDEIKDYKEKIYFFNFRQWIFAILIVASVVPTYLLLKDKIGEEVTSYIVIAIAGVLGFIGFVKIHELPAEQIIPYWFRHYFLFAKPIHYIPDKEYAMQHEKKKRQKSTKKDKTKKDKAEIKEIKKRQKEEKMLENAKKKYADKFEKQEKKKKTKEIKNNDNNNKLAEKLSKLSKEEQDLLLKLLER